MHPTRRESATGGFDPFALARDQEFGNVQRGAEVIDNVGPGWVTVTRRDGKPLDPAANLSDSIIYDNGAGPGVKVEIRDTRGTS